MIHNKQLPWQMAAVRRAAVFWLTLPLEVSTAYWTTWARVFAPEGTPGPREN